MEMTPKGQAAKAILNKWDYIKLKSFCTAKRINNKVKKQSTEQEKIFANHIPDNGLISKIYKELKQLNRKIKKQPNLKWTKDLKYKGPADYMKMYDKKQQMLAMMWRNGNPWVLLVGIQISAAITENIMEVPQKK